MKLSSKTIIFVTGSNGFLGKKLCTTLSKKKYQVIHASRSMIDNQHQNLDLKDKINWKIYLNDVDTIIHTAARVHLAKDNEFNLYDKINTEATLNLARQAASLNIRRFIFISTAKVSGEESVNGRPFKETDKINNKSDAYTTSKLNAEKLLLDLSRNSSMEVVIIRPPLVYGPKVKANFLSMMNWVKRSFPFPIKKNINLRSFIYIDNLIDFIILTINHPNAKNEIFHISDNFDISTVDLIKKVSIVMKKRILFIDFPEWLLSLVAIIFRKEKEVKKLKNSLQIDVSKAEKLLNWKPLVDFDKAINITVNYFYDKKN